jgi:hypothetical protein
MAAWLEAPHRAAPPLVAWHGREGAITGDFPHQRVDDEVFDPIDDDRSIGIELEPDPAQVIILS